MAKLVYAMMLSLDGYVSAPEGGPELPMEEALTQHFNDQMTEVGIAYRRPSHCDLMLRCAFYACVS